MFSFLTNVSSSRFSFWKKLTCCVVLLLAGVACAESITSDALSNLNLGMPKFGLEDDIQVNADRMVADHEAQVVTLAGNVKVAFTDITLTCDNASYNYATGDIDAEGNVQIVSKSGGSWKGDSISFNHKTGEGLIGTGMLRLGQFAVLADSIARDEDGVAYSNNATITTCTNEMCDWHWSVTGTGRYKAQEFVELKDAVVRFWGIPIAWAPYYYRDFNTHYGWRIMPGYTSKWGAYLLTAYVYPIAGNVRDDHFLYGKTGVDLRTEYGVAVGQELTWRTYGGFLGEDTIQHGHFTAYLANHREDQKSRDRNWQSPYGDYRYTIGLNERLDFTPRDHFTFVGEYVSDSQFRSDYKELRLREISQPMTLANYEHRENAWATSLSAGGPLNKFYAGVQRLPEWRFDVVPQNVFGISKLYYESQSSVGWFRRQPAKNRGVYDPSFRYAPGNWAYYDSARIDTRHVLRRPFTIVDGLTLTPRLGWEGTYYSDSPDGDSYFRSLFEIGATLQARFWRDYEKYRHTITPYVDVMYVPGSHMDEDDVPYAFDRIDQAYEWNDRFASDGLTPKHRYTGVRLGTRNLWQKRGEENILTRYLDVDAYGIFVAQTQDHWVHWRNRDQPGRHHNRLTPATRVKDEKGLRVLGLDAVFSPTRKIDFMTDFQYDPEEGRLAFWDIGMRARWEKFTFYAGYLRRNHDMYDYYWTDTIKDSLVYGGFIHSLCDTVDWSVYARYNLEVGDLEEIGGFFQYSLDCISFRLNMEYLTSYETDDGYEHDSDFKVSFGVWLRAFPREEDHDWMSWGNLTNMRQLEDVKE